VQESLSVDRESCVQSVVTWDELLASLAGDGKAAVETELLDGAWRMVVSIQKGTVEIRTIVRWGHVKLGLHLDIRHSLS
jgi:hypothetical protein